MIARYLACLLAGVAVSGSSLAVGGELALWYEKPAQKWEEALPLGNGRLGAMVFGGAGAERIQLNEESLWAGEPTDVYPENFTHNLRKVQALVLNGKIVEARALGLKTLTKSPTSFRSYEPLGDLRIEVDHPADVDDYRRELDLETGLASVTYRAGSTRFRRHAFISAADDALVIRLQADTPKQLRAKIRLTRPEDATITAVAPDCLHLDGQVVDVAAPQGHDDNPGGSGPGGKHMKFAGRLRVFVEGGTVKPEGNALTVEGADEAVILFTAATDYSLDKMSFDRTLDPGREAQCLLENAAKQPWTGLLKKHVAEHRAHFNRVSLKLGHSQRADIPTDQRLSAVRGGETDPGLAAIYFQYGRYLLMSSSRRPGRLPANLQGIWNQHMWAPWEADYHLNINLQMNYWPADVANLPETIGPLVDWLVRLSENGKVSASRLYDADGWVAYTSTNPFGRTTPAGSTKQSQFVNGVLDPLAGAWMAMTLWRHYEYTQDRQYLRQHAYPVIKGAAEFLLDYLVEDSDGRLVIVPSTSPENSYIHPQTRQAVRITRGSTYHTSVVRVVFQAVIDASRALQRDQRLRSELETALAKLPPIQIGGDGTIQEWIEDYKERYPDHRHVSHLIGLHPFPLISRETPELLEAASKTIERRGFGGDVGWSNAWKTCFFARLHDAEQAHWYLNRLIGKNAFPNLLDGYLPGRIFQVDGNFGGTAGIAEMLLQSHTGEVELLPALPKAWPAGSVQGLRAQGGFEVGITWRDGRLAEATIRSSAGRDPIIRYADQTKKITLEPAQQLVLGRDLSIRSP